MTAPVILAIDPGKSAGWCIRPPTGPCIASVAMTAAERHTAIGLAIENASIRGVPLVVVVEQWTNGSAGNKRWTPAVMLGTGAQRGRWFEALELAGIPAARVVPVTPATWRKVLGGMPRRTTEQCKASAMLVARGLMQRECGPDEAEAVCIAAWAARSPEVAAMAAKKVRAKRAAPGAVKPRSAKRAASALTSAGCRLVAGPCDRALARAAKGEGR